MTFGTVPSMRHQFPFPTFDHNIITIVGGFGSGKSEVSVNLARSLATRQELAVALADLDIVNPYFRSREAASELNKLGVKSLLPPGEQVHADLPIIIPEIKGAISGNQGMLILDVGGDDMGARLLRSLQNAFVRGQYELLLVLNANRPFTSTIDGALKMIDDIEKASGMTFTGIISNTHMMDETTIETVMDGYRFSKELASVAGLPVKCLSATGRLAAALDPAIVDSPVLTLDRSLLKPWERHDPADRDAS